MPKSFCICAIAVVGVVLWTAEARAALKPAGPRKVVSLDGTWQIAEGELGARPERFDRSVPVPGLVDLAQPAFVEVGKSSPRRTAFWYRRTFKVEGKVPDVAILKLHKARYGTKVFLNGEVVGEHLPCFTPAYLDVKPHLKGEGQENELVIRVGANRGDLPAGMPTGWDFEKYLYIPGIYDSVELLLTGRPYIVSVQAVPDIEKKAVRLVVELEGGKQAGRMSLQARVKPVTADVPGGVVQGSPWLAVKPAQPRHELELPLEDCRLWSPDDPFLYEASIEAKDGGQPADAVKLRFGMRSFKFDGANQRAILNGKPYYLRGTNVTLYRFFEDALRGDRPWRREWVERLHRQYKSMHWDSLRHCIGFPPEFWYDIADEQGFLIQDEFPIWVSSKAPEWPAAEKIIPEYTAWMRERWNHPCVVIWDAQNESVTPETGKAIAAVRGLDLSNRPWDNGWSPAQAAGDCVESHPYLFIRAWSKKPPFRLADIETTSVRPELRKGQEGHAILINEYDWLWLNRDGSPTCLTEKVYETLLGKNSTVEQRRKLHARYVAALTEFWRCHRQAAGVMHFCGLGYSRAGDKPRPEGGATSDDFLDIESLAFEPLFAEHVREAFSPLGLMLDFWKESVDPGAKVDLKLVVINDLEKKWSGEVAFYLSQGERKISLGAQPCSVEGYGREVVTQSAAMPEQPGDYTLVAETRNAAGQRVRSMRDFKVEKRR